MEARSHNTFPQVWEGSGAWRVKAGSQGFWGLSQMWGGGEGDRAECYHSVPSLLASPGGPSLQQQLCNHWVPIFPEGVAQLQQGVGVGRSFICLLLNRTIGGVQPGTFSSGTEIWPPLGWALAGMWWLYQTLAWITRGCYLQHPSSHCHDLGEVGNCGAELLLHVAQEEDAGLGHHLSQPGYGHLSS